MSEQREDEPARASTIVGGEEYIYERYKHFAVVERRGGEHPFRQAYDDAREALGFFERCVGAAHLRRESTTYRTFVEELWTPAKQDRR